MRPSGEGRPGAIRGQPDDGSDVRGLMFSIAYRMTGSVTEAEDVAQEAFFRLERARRSGVVIDSRCAPPRMPP
jgi:Sigma-70 region 2